MADELEEMGLSAAQSARNLGVPINRITQIINGERNIAADTALRLSHWFGTSAEFWLNLQKSYELRLAQAESGEQLKLLPRRSDIPQAA